MVFSKSLSEGAQAAKTVMTTRTSTKGCISCTKNDSALAPQILCGLQEIPLREVFREGVDTRRRILFYFRLGYGP